MENLSPAQRNRAILKEFEESKPPDYMLICAFSSREYDRYERIWRKCVKMAYPKYDQMVIRLPEGDPNKMAASRFLGFEDEIGKYPYVLITDIDMLIMNESPSLLYQHLLHMKRYSLKCYSNAMSDVYRPSGVHFITNEWWQTTQLARDVQTKELEASESVWGMDEMILGKVIIESGLPIVQEPMLWNHHGIHLGSYKRSKTINLDGNRGLLLEKLGVKPPDSYPTYSHFVDDLLIKCS